MRNKKILNYLAIISAMFLWGMSFIWSKLAFETYQPFTVLFFRLSIASIFLLILSKSLGILEKIKKEDYKLLLLLSFFEPFLYFIGENFGLQFVSASTASIIIATIPLFMPFLGYYFFSEQIRQNNIIGVLISVIGVLMIILKPNLSLSGHPIGFALIFLAVFSALAYTVVLKKVSHKYNSFTIVTWQSVIASLAFLPFFIINDFQDFSKIGILNTDFIFILLLGIFASSLAFLLYTQSIKYFGLAKIGIFSNLIPMFTVTISFFVLDEKLNAIKYLGIVLVIIGLFLSERKRKFKK